MTPVYLFLQTCDGDAKTSSRTLTPEGAKRFFAAIGQEERPVVYLESGKPVFSDRCPVSSDQKPSTPFLSVSHADNLFLAAFSTVPIGVDAEKRREGPVPPAQKYFAPEERNGDFYALWTQKEAVSKVNGEGISALRKIKISGKEALFGGNKFHLFSLQAFLPPDFAGHIAVLEEQVEVVLL